MAEQSSTEKLLFTMVEKIGENRKNFLSLMQRFEPLEKFFQAMEAAPLLTGTQVNTLNTIEEKLRIELQARDEAQDFLSRRLGVLEAAAEKAASTPEKAPDSPSALDSLEERINTLAERLDALESRMDAMNTTPDEKPEVKMRRKRRTRAEMEEARAQGQSQTQSQSQSQEGKGKPGIETVRARAAELFPGLSFDKTFGVWPAFETQEGGSDIISRIRADDIIAKCREVREAQPNIPDNELCHEVAEQTHAPLEAVVWTFENMTAEHLDFLSELDQLLKRRALK